MTRVQKWYQPADFTKVTSHSTAERFITECLSDNSTYDFPDVNDQDRYYSIIKENGKVLIGNERYGLFLPIALDDRDVIKRIYEARKSINAYFFRDN